MNRLLAIMLMTLFLAAAARAQDSVHLPSWQLQPEDDRIESPLSSIFPTEPMSFRGPSPLAERPRLSVSLSTGTTTSPERLPTVSWSLEAWEMNTASLAHIQCSRATRTIESFLIEDCRFVDQPLPDDSSSLVQVQGQWMAAPGLAIGAGAFAGRQQMFSGAGSGFNSVEASGIGGGLAEDIEGVNMNVSFGLSLGQIGSLLLDLQLERYRQTPESFSLNRGPVPSTADNNRLAYENGRSYSNAGQLGVAWRGSRFGADLTGQYQELPYWMGEDLQGEGFRSFDIEFSWRAPARSSISVGVSNVLNRLPGASGSADQAMEEAVDGIYGRIPYVRYKHDL
ncbi:MAG TPA: hypothetical protein VKO85_11545 [Wenzhouxiangellaceae bacterium]|nr:hypothetical protein [Wenzhouxiangellaceae bacterium]